MYFVTFVLIAQFVLVNVVVAVLMKHLEESNKEAKEDAEMDAEIEMEMEMARRLSNVSAASSSGPEGRATYVGSHPDSPGQVYMPRFATNYSEVINKQCRKERRFLVKPCIYGFKVFKYNEGFSNWDPGNSRALQQSTRVYNT